MTKIRISPSILAKSPRTRLACLKSSVEISTPSAALRGEIEKEQARIIENFSLDNVNDFAPIRDSREAYKALGKEPSRYRPSGEALYRRTLKGTAIYKINNIVDMVNLISLKSGFSIGGYDYDKIQGDILFEKGQSDVEYLAIGRGSMNIENLPCFHDELGPFGSPTSDSLRTMVTDMCKNFLMIIVDFNEDESLDRVVDLSKELLWIHGASAEVEYLLVN